MNTPLAVRPLSRRQRDIFTYLIEKTRITGIQPSMREMCDTFAMASPTGVHCHLKAMEKKGWIALSHPKTGLRSPSRSVRFLRNLDGTPFEGWVQDPRKS